MEREIPERTGCLVAKMDREKDMWLPLWVHSLDTWFVAGKLLDEWMSGNTRRTLEEGFQEDALRNVIATLAVLHDIGKATTLFQARITEHCPLLRDALAKWDLVLPDREETEEMRSRKFPHAAAGEVLLMMEGCPLTFAEVVGAHHGEPLRDGKEIQQELQETGLWKDIRAVTLWGNREHRDAWRSVQKECLEWMLDTVNCPSLTELPGLPQTKAVLLTGLIIMADWIASNSDFFPLIPMTDKRPVHMEERWEKGWKALSLPPAWKPGDTDSRSLSQDRFGFAPNAVQQTMMDTVENSGHLGLMILEAPMGIGKTEAALLTVDLLGQRGVGGLFFGLPTQATANAIFDRIVQWGDRQPKTNQISIRLAHGMADLNESYQGLMAGSRTSSIEEDGTDTDRLVVHEWFRGSKQGLLADFVIGTVDQVLMAALRQKHIMLRHLGLSGKTVIIDECHAYDAYMNQYLKTMLRWLGQYRVPVIMLSATLPVASRAEYVAAYLGIPDRARRNLRNEEWYACRAYPALTWTDGRKIYQKALTYDGAEHEVSMIRVSCQETENEEEQAERIAGILQNELKEGGCAAVVVNTVRKAQAFYETLQEKLQDMQILLLHSRFVTPDRLRCEKELLSRMGKQSRPEDRDRVVVIGTQVIEQSLDFDADLMISDLCPVDLLMQRIGRLHRHRRERPEPLRKARCYVLFSGETSDQGSRKVYGDYLLMRTSALMPDAVKLPGDISSLVNDVYDPEHPLPVEPADYARAKEEHLQRIHKLESDAEGFRVHNPERRYSELLYGQIPSDEEHARAQVRAGEVTMDVLLLVRVSEGVLSRVPWLREGESWSVDVRPAAEECRKILSQRISLSAGLTRMLAREVTWEGVQNMLAVPPAWAASPWFRYAHMLVLNSQLEIRIGGIDIWYSKTMGLQWRKDGG